MPNYQIRAVPLLPEDKLTFSFVCNQVEQTPCLDGSILQLGFKVVQEDRSPQRQLCYSLFVKKKGKSSKKIENKEKKKDLEKSEVLFVIERSKKIQRWVSLTKVATI